MSEYKANARPIIPVRAAYSRKRYAVAFQEWVVDEANGIIEQPAMCSVKGDGSGAFYTVYAKMNRYYIDVMDDILKHRECYHPISSGFLDASWFYNGRHHPIGKDRQ